MLKSDEELLSELDDLRAEVERLRDLRFVMVAERDAEIERLRAALQRIVDYNDSIVCSKIARDALTGGKDDATSVYGAECDPRAALTGGKE